MWNVRFPPYLTAVVRHVSPKTSSKGNITPTRKPHKHVSVLLDCLSALSWESKLVPTCLLFWKADKHSVISNNVFFYLSLSGLLLKVQSIYILTTFSSCQPLSPSSQRRLKQLMDKHGSGKIYKVIETVVGSRELDLNLARGELVAVISQADTRGDKRRWLVDAGGENHMVLLCNSKPLAVLFVWRI